MLLGPHGSKLEHDGAAQLPLGTRVWYPGVREDGSESQGAGRTLGLKRGRTTLLDSGLRDKGLLGPED